MKAPHKSTASQPNHRARAPWPLVLLVWALAASTCGAAVAAQPGSPQAAKKLVTVFLAEKYTIVDEPVINGDKATVKAHLLDLHCTAGLVRHPSANRSGWVVEKLDCTNPRSVKAKP